MSHLYMAGHGEGANDAFLASRALGWRKVRACAIYDSVMTSISGEQFISDVPIVSVCSESFVSAVNLTMDINI